jgi:hypothetical protein
VNDLTALADEANGWKKTCPEPAQPKRMTTEV